MYDVVVIGSGAAGAMAAWRAAELGARTAVLTSAEFGGMTAHDGPVPVRTLAHAARLMRDARQRSAYGIAVGEPRLDYSSLLRRVRVVAAQVADASSRRADLDRMGVSIVEHAGLARFVDAHTVVLADGSLFEAATFVVCVGGVPRSLPVPGGELALTHSAAWAIEQPPGSMIVIGGGATGTQGASVFQAFGTQVELIQVNGSILPGGDEDVSAAVSDGFRRRGIAVQERVDSIDVVEQTHGAMRVTLTIDGVRRTSTADVVLAAIGWAANVDALGLSSIGVELDGRGFIAVDDYQQTSVPHVFAAGDVTGAVQLVPEANQAGYVAATNAVRGPVARRPSSHGPLGSFTDPEFASVGLTESQARENHDVEVVSIGFDQTTRSIIDGHAEGFCKLVVDRDTRQVLGCHVVGDRAVDIAQVAYMAMHGGVDVVRLAQMPLSFPTYAGMLARVAHSAAQSLGVDIATGPR